MKLSHILASGLFALTLGAFSAPSQAGILTFNFTGLCDDCAGDFELFPGNPDNVFDDIFEPVTAVLTLKDYTPGDFLDPSNLVSFSYGGSSLIDPFTIFGGLEEGEDGEIGDGPPPPPPGAIFGIIEADGTIPPFIGDGEFGEVAIFGFDPFLGPIDFYLDDFGFWEVFLGFDDCDCAADFGLAGSFTPAPAPGALVLLGVGLLGLGARRRWFA